MKPPAETPSWLVLIYRVPSEPASRRVSVWRDLKRLGAQYLQQCVCVLPRVGTVPDDLARVIDRIARLEGESTLLEVPALRPEDEARIMAEFRTQRNHEYAEIVEECETKFVKEIEFEHYRQNYTFEEAEEIQQDLEKIERWFATIQQRDWFGADLAEVVEGWLEQCRKLLAEFEEEVYRRTNGEEPRASTSIPIGLPFGRPPSDPPLQMDDSAHA